MTVSTTDNKVVYTGNDSITQFPYDYRMDNDDDMEVWLDEVVQTSGYTVTRNPDNIGGVVDFLVAPANEVVITLLRVIVETQETDYTPYDSFPAEAHEDALDKLTMITQQIQEQADRNSQAIGGEEGVDTTAPPFEANKAWKWDDGTDHKIINSTYNPDEQALIAQNYANSAQTSATNAQLESWNAQAEEMTAASYAVQPEDVLVDIWTSNDNGTFTSTPTTDFSSLHWAAKSEGSAAAGEANTSSNAGTGEGLALPKSGVNLPFRSLKVTGAGSINSDADSTTINIVGNTDHDALSNRDAADQHPQSAITGLVDALNLKAPIDSPTLTGTPKTSQPTAGDNTDRIATTAFVQSSAGGIPDAPADGSINARSNTAWLDIKQRLATAWCVFDGTLVGTNAPIDGYNVTSVTRNSIGDYNVNFSTAMDNNLYSFTGISNQRHVQCPNSDGVTAFANVRVSDNSHLAVDGNRVMVHVFGGKN